MDGKEYKVPRLLWESLEAILLAQGKRYVREMAKTLKVKGVNLQVWFATTGKKNPAIKKAGKGHYKLVGK